MFDRLLGKGQRKVHQYMKSWGYCLYDFVDSVAEYYKTHAGVTIDTVFVVYHGNRVVGVER